jgi:hypothetical protein
VTVWEVATGEQILYLSGHLDSVQALVFHPDSRRLVSAGADRTALVWDLLSPALLEEEEDPSPARPDELAGLWRDLGERRGAVGHRAVVRLVCTPGADVYLGRRLRAAPKRDQRRIQRFVAELDSDDFETREAAARSLAELGGLAGPELLAAARTSSSAEVRRQAAALLKRAAGAVSGPERLRGMRAVQVLEHRGTPQARRVLRALARGEPLAELTRDARAALRRLERWQKGR